MKIIVVGGTGAVGQAVVNELKKDHSLIVVGRERGDIQVDITDKNSIEAMYKAVGKFDAVVATAGKLHFGPLEEFTAEQYNIGLQNKLMGQVNLVLLGLKHINDRGSFTLTSGILSHDPIKFGSSAAMVNGALDAFVKSAAIEMPRNIRINSVSPTVLTESLDTFADYFKGFESAPGARVALAYRKSVDGAQTGQTFRVW